MISLDKRSQIDRLLARAAPQNALHETGKEKGLLENLTSL
ncbi:hypothetical protein HMPREF3204_00465 [Gardnerella pickettii]|nr:hypothetical protein HMPREF3204_00465 [Gardnerella pickettii]